MIRRRVLAWILAGVLALVGCPCRAQIGSSPIGDTIGGSAGAAGPKTVLIPFDWSANNGTFRVRTIGSTATHRISFHVPLDFSAIYSAHVVGIVGSAGAAGSSKDIDLFSSYGKLGELSTQHAEQNTSATYTIPAVGQVFELDVAIVLSDLQPGDIVGLEINHGPIGGPIDYIGLRFRY